jgi:integrase
MFRARTFDACPNVRALIRQRIYRGVIDSPKTSLSVRQAALPEGLLGEIEAWRAVSPVTKDNAWVFPSERMTPMSKDNSWNRDIKPKLAKVGLAWANFLVMRRTHSTLMGELGIDGKLVADQCGHTLDVSQNVYRQSPVASRLPAVNQLEISLNGVQTEFSVPEGAVIN